jgi:hypothetical protein
LQFIRRGSDRAEAQIECRSLDGTRIEVFANLGNIRDATAAVANGAEGCGLLRTEFLFLDRDSAPSEAEQLAAYQGIAAALGNKPLILRLMDVGGDKPLRYLPLPAPGICPAPRFTRRPHGWRARSAAHPAACCPAGPTGRPGPASHPDGHRCSGNVAVRGVIEELASELAISAHIQLGAMIETPAAALTAAGLLRGRFPVDRQQRFDAVHSRHGSRTFTACRRTDAAPGGAETHCSNRGRRNRGRQDGGRVRRGRRGSACRTHLLGLGVRELSVVPRRCLPSSARFAPCESNIAAIWHCVVSILRPRPRSARG